MLEKLKPFVSALPVWMQNYSLPYNMSVEGELAEAGVREMRDLATRNLRSAGHLKPVEYTTEKFQLAHTVVHRTAESAAAYVVVYLDGIFVIGVLMCCLVDPINPCNRFAGAYFSNPHDVHFIEYPKENVRAWHSAL